MEKKQPNFFFYIKILKTVSFQITLQQINNYKKKIVFIASLLARHKNPFE